MTRTSAERYNARLHKIFENARALKYANAYPKLVEALGQLAFPNAAQFKRDEAEAKAQQLLRELGEIK